MIFPKTIKPMKRWKREGGIERRFNFFKMNKLKMNNRGKTSGLMVVGVISIVAIAIFLAMGVTNTALGGGGSSSSGTCEINPTLTVSAVNALNKGTAVAGLDLQGSINGGAPETITSGTTTFAKGDVVKLLVNRSDFINEVVTSKPLNCGTNRLDTVELFATSTNTFRAFNTDGQPLTDGFTGAENQTESASPINVDLRIDSTSDESTGDLIIVVEAVNTTEVDAIKLSGLGGAKSATTPDFYSANSANSIIKTFSVPALLDGASVAGTLTFDPESGQTMGVSAGGTNVYVTAYSSESFIDTDGSIINGIENKDGTVKYEDTWDFDFKIGDAS